MPNLYVSALTVLALVLGFFLPGYFLSILLRSPARLLSSFCLSLLVLFHAVFWTGVAGVRLEYWPVLVVLALATVLAYLACRRWPPPDRKIEGEVARPSRFLSFLMWITALAAAAVMFFRSIYAPLSGYDTAFRWHYLSLQMLKEGTFAFYPPQSAVDFKSYFYPDGIPPLVSFSYWWEYAALGRPVPWLTGLLVTAQFLLLVLITYRLARKLHSPVAGCVAVVVLLASPLFFWAVVMGQETGLTALSLGAAIYFIAEAAEEATVPRLILAGLCAAVGGLAREYGVAFILCGVLACRWLRISWGRTSVFVAVALVALVPWYVRNWELTGNPVYSIPVDGLFPVNPVHAGILESYREQIRFTPERVKTLASGLAAFATVPVILGLAGGVILFRKLGTLVAAVAVVVFLWLYSVPFTVGGSWYSLRVLSPALLLCAVLAGVACASVPLPGLKKLVALAVFLCCLWAIPADLFVPTRLWDGLRFGLPREPLAGDPSYAQLASTISPVGRRVLSDNAYSFVGLTAYDIEVVPVWSPEVRFLFEGRLTPREMRQRLIDLGIRVVEYNPAGPNGSYLRQSAFFDQDVRNWKLLLLRDRSGIFLLQDRWAEREVW